MNNAWLRALGRVLGSSVLLAVLAAVLAGGAIALGVDDTPTMAVGAQPLKLDEEGEEEVFQQDLAYTSSRTAGDRPLDAVQAGALRNAAVDAKLLLKKNLSPTGPTTFNNGWTALGPNPIVQSQRSDGAFAAQSGRIGALAIRPSNHQFILGAAQGGIWLYDAASGTWSPKTDNLPSLAIGALAVAPSNDAVVYAGTGEGALSGDSMFGDGILKSSNGGNNWTHVSGDYFQGVSVSGLAVDPTNANHLYAAVLRGRGGARRVTPTAHSRYGIWESKDGGVTWTLLKEAKSEFNGATDIAIDPQNPNVLYASFWADAMYKSTDGGQSWSPIMDGLPNNANFAAGSTRFSIGVSHPSAASPAVLYAGFDYVDTAGAHHAARVWKSTNAGASWELTATGTGLNAVTNYCDAQCSYDNVIEVDPTNPSVVYAGGSFGYNLSPPSGGLFRSDDGGQTWINLGWDLHPDFHALAFDPSNPNHILVGNDGGVRFSEDRGGRPNGPADPLSAVTWQNLDGTVDPNTAGVLHRTGLQISQFSSVATVPQVPAGAASERFWGGTQDNGTLRKSVNSATWFDVSSGDGGQVLVDPTSDSCGSLGPSCFVYGTYFSPPAQNYRYTDGGNFFTASFIRSGINVNDRSDFYAPWAMNLQNTNQLFYGTYRLYRTNSARAADPGNVRWSLISPDLTSGCTGTAPNGARNCSISAIGVGGGNAVYTGSLDGSVYLSTDGQVSDTPNWTRLDPHHTVLPNRPVASIAVDRSNYRIAYLGYNGYNAATPTDPGHVFRTKDSGKTWVDISGDLPDAPVNSLILDPSYPNTLYAGTDVGPMVTYNGGGHWQPLGSAIPNVSVWQLDMDPAHRIMAAGTHGRGAWRLADSSPAVPALVLSKNDAGVPVGASSNLDYTIKLRNVGSADATGVTITDPLPANTSFVSADNGGTFANGVVTWSGLSVPKGVPGTGGSITVHFRVKIADALKKVNSIVNDGVTATSAEGPSTTGSPAITPIAPPFALSLSPAAQTDGARAGNSATYHVFVKNLGSNSDSYNMTSTGGTYAVSFFDSTCTTAQTTTPTVAPGSAANVCVEVAVPGGAADGDTSTSTVTATSVGSPSVSASGTVKTIAVTKDWLLVDEDGDAPDVRSFYTTALDSKVGAGAYSVWDLATDRDLPQGYLTAHKYVVWFTGNSYPGPITPYESELKALLDGGGNLFLSGQDLLDQGAGTTAFVHDYLHVTWDGSETQNDKATAHVNGQAGTITDGIGAIPLNHSVLNAAFEDRITPNGTAVPIFKDDGSPAATPPVPPQPDGLSFSGTYKVVFIAFPMEAYGTADDKADLVSRVKAFFGA